MRSSIIVIFSEFLILLIALPGTSQAAPPGNLRVSYINVGEGDSALLRDETGFDVLIDGGDPSAGPTVVAYLRQLGIDDVDVMVATHAHDDHIGGLIDVLAMSDIPVRAVYYNGYPSTTTTWSDFVSAVSNEGLALTPLQYPAGYSWGSLNVSVLGPANGLSSPDQNDASVALGVQHGSVTYLFTGDIGSTAEDIILARGNVIASQILKVAHHGHASSSSASFLSAVHPAEAIISVGPNPFGLPAPETLSRLQAVGARVHRTDQCGTVVVTDNGSTYQVVCSNAVNTTTGLSSSVNPSINGQPFTLTATVSGKSPTGSVTLKESGVSIAGCEAVALSGATATCSVAPRTAGSHSLTAEYSGDPQNHPSTSAILIQVIHQANTTTAHSVSANPSLHGQMVTWTATVNVVAPGSGLPSGTLQFQVDGDSLGPAVALSGTGASLSTAALSLGAHSLTAVYGGDDGFASSTSNVLWHLVNAPEFTLYLPLGVR